MKKVLGLLIACVFSASFSEAASTNFKKLVQNDDGSVAIVAPAFKVEGANYGISRTSSYEGVCKLYGYEFAIASFYNPSGDTDTVLINKAGKLVDTNAGYYPLSVIWCSSAAAKPTPSKFAKEISANDDGTVSILYPRFGNKEFHFGISRNSNFNGVCKLFGFKKATASEYDPSADTNTIQINADGRMVSANAEYYPISLIVCE